MTTDLKKEVLHRAIDLLSRREHSHQELFQKLINKTFVSEDIQPVLEYLIKKDYLSDERFADSLLRGRVAKGYGWLYIQNELKQKGVSSQIINQLNKNDEIDWYLQAELAYNKRFGHALLNVGSLDADSDEHNSFALKTKAYKAAAKEKAKRIRFLQYRGFSTEQITTALNVNVID
jgi:regulatory protein